MKPTNNKFLWQFSIPVTLLALSIFVASANDEPVLQTRTIIDFPAEAPAGMVLYPVESNTDWQIEGDAPVTGARLDYSSEDGEFHVDYS
jgi:hypothetical protein